MAEEGMLFSELAMEVAGETGRLLEAAVEGLRSWAGSGWCFMEADWMVEAISIAGLDIVGDVVVSLNDLSCLAGRLPKYQMR